MPEPFAGIRILDLTHAFSGPFAARQFADYGAEVIKIEHAPDDSQGYPPLIDGWSGYYELLNRGKRGLSLNLKDPEQYAHFLTLVQNADVVLENFVPGVKQRLNVGYTTLARHNSRLVYASLSGIGQHSERKYYDVLAQAESGLLSLTGTVDSPMKIGPSVVDAFSGMTLAFAIASALLQRERTGGGQWVELSMLGCALHLTESNLVATSITSVDPVRTGNHDNLIAPFGIYTTHDGYLALAVGNDVQWKQLSAWLYTHQTFDATLYASNADRLAHLDQLTKLIDTVFGQYVKIELLHDLTALGIPCAPVNRMTDVLTNKALFESGELVYAESPIGRFAMPGRAIRFEASQSHDSQLPFEPAPRISRI